MKWWLSTMYCTGGNFRQRKISSKATVRQFVRNLFSSKAGRRSFALCSWKILVRNLISQKIALTKATKLNSWRKFFAIQYCKRRKFRREFNFVLSFRIIEKKYEIKFHTEFSSTWFAGLSVVSSRFYFFFGQFESSKLNSIRNVLDAKVQNFSPSKASFFTEL